MNCINRIVTILAVLLAAILLASPTHAGDCFPFVRPVYRPPVIVAPPVHVPVQVVKPIVATFVPIPTFSAVYDPRIVAYPGVPGGLPVAGVPGEGVPGVPVEGQPAFGQPATQAPQATPSSGNEVLDLLRQMASRLDRLEAQGLPPAPFDYGRVSLPSQVVQAAPVQARLGRNAVMLARCASCHDDSTAGAKGNGLVLTRGGRVVQMSEALSASVDEEVRSGRMPKGPPLSDSQRQQFLQR